MLRQQTTGSSPLAVMFYIHGGGFSAGTSFQYPGVFLAAKDVIVVVPNFRLNVFGKFASRWRQCFRRGETAGSVHNIMYAATYFEVFMCHCRYHNFKTGKDFLLNHKDT